MCKKDKILIIGGAGFIGSHMVKMLSQNKKEVIILDNLSSGHEYLITAGTLIKGDMGNIKDYEYIFQNYNINLVIHFASSSLVGESVKEPLKYYYNNVSKTITLLKLMKKYNIKKIIFSSSAAIFGNPEKIPIDEDCPLNPITPYGRSKLMIEEILRDCDKSWGLKYISLRYFNAAGADLDAQIGEDHNPETHLIPTVLQVVLNLRKNIEIYGTDYPTYDGTCIRDYIHVNDICRAHLLGMEYLDCNNKSQIFNIGNGEGFSVKEVIETAQVITNSSIPYIKSDRRYGDAVHLVASSKKIQKELGWSPQIPDLKSIIKSAWTWHKKQYNKNYK